MSFKETSVHIQRSFEYQSPDGDEYVVTYSETPDRKYVEIVRKGDADGTTKVVHDYDLLCGIVDGIRESVRPKVKPQRNLKKPKISDKRTFGERIQSTVDKSMSQYDDDVSPRASLTASVSPETQFSHEARTGMSIEEQGEVPDTPAEWAVPSEAEAEAEAEGEVHVPKWKQDATDRSKVARPLTKSKGGSGEGFRRPDANDLI